MAKSKLSGLHAAQIATMDLDSPTQKAKPIIHKRELEEQYELIATHLIVFETNIRKEEEYDEESIIELAASMKEYGQLQPIRVYENDNGEYAVLFGHRRVLAARKAALPQMKCLLTPKPDTIDKLYIQAIENEQAKELSPSDREDYVYALLEAGETEKEIYTKLGKSSSWLSKIKKAHEGRLQHEEKFNEKGISLTTKDAYLLNDVTDEETEKALAEIMENPEEKARIIQSVSKAKPYKATKGRSKPNKTPATEKESAPSFLNEPSVPPSEEDQTKEEPDAAASFSLNTPLIIEGEDNIDIIASDETETIKIMLMIDRHRDSNTVSINVLPVTETNNGVFDMPILIETLKNSTKTYFDTEGYSIA
jgi:ParB family chromosome partitioning protein